MKKTNQTASREVIPARVSKQIRAMDPKLAGLKMPRASFNCGSAGLAFFLAEESRLNGASIKPAREIVRYFDQAARSRKTSFDFELEAGSGPSPFAVDDLAAGVYTGLAGMGYVELLVAEQSGETALREKGLARIDAAFRTHAVREFPQTELYMGTAGYIAMVHDLASRGIAHRVLDDVKEKAADRLAAHYRTNPKRDLLGAAHGTTGELLSLLLVPEVIGPKVLRKRLDAFLKQATVEGEYIAWPVRANGEVPSTMWATLCNGIVGQALIYLRAAKVLGDAHYHEAAVRASTTVHALPSGNASICCGSAGAAITLDYAGRVLGDSKWVRRAKTRLELAVRTGSEPNRFLSGEVGIAWLQTLRAKREPLHAPFLRGL
jgi:eukaryotic-like serine/threonine-protein kinase